VKDPDMTLGAAIRARRVSKNWTLDDLAARSRVEKATISKIETGRQEGRLATLVALCRALELSLDEITGLKPRRKRNIAPVRRLLEEALERLDELGD
jgi:transcriptional regulator with XRE-family HTH domain